MERSVAALIQKQSLPLESKILLSERRIKEWYDHWNGDVYLSFSGGKDSTVLKHLIENTPGVCNVPSVFVDTGLEYPELRTFAIANSDRVIKPKFRFDQVIQKYGYPIVTKRVADCVEGARRNPNSSRMARLKGECGGRRDGKPSKFDIPQWYFLLDAPFKISAKCCDVMKKEPLKRFQKETNLHPYVGILASESQGRKAEWIHKGCNAYDSSDPQSRPLSFWTEQDILQYIRRYQLPYASVYGEIVEENGVLRTTGCDRTGCMFCMFGCHLEKGENRFQKMKKTHPKQWEYCMRPVEEKGLGLKQVLDFLNVPCE